MSTILAILARKSTIDFFKERNLRCFDRLLGWFGNTVLVQSAVIVRVEILQVRLVRMESLFWESLSYPGGVSKIDATFPKRIAVVCGGYNAMKNSHFYKKVLWTKSKEDNPPQSNPYKTPPITFHMP